MAQGGRRIPTPLTYRLRRLPRPDDRFRGAAVEQLLATLCVRAVSRRWMQWKTGMDSAELDTLLAWLAAQHLLETVRLQSVAPPGPAGSMPANLAVV
jgi:hypothetical protein